MNLTSKSEMAFVVLLTGSITATGLSLSPIAQADKPDDPNCFGDSASDLAQSDKGAMGQHSRAGGAAGEPPFDEDDEPGRQGIGNVGDDDDNNIHPSDLAEALGGDCD